MEPQKVLFIALTLGKNLNFYQRDFMIFNSLLKKIFNQCHAYSLVFLYICRDSQTNGIQGKDLQCLPSIENDLNLRHQMQCSYEDLDNKCSRFLQSLRLA